MTGKNLGTILIVEDEYWIAIDLMMAFDDANVPTAIAHNCREAFAILDKEVPIGAVLDVNLGKGETCWPIAERLSAMGVPYVLHTGDLNRQGEILATIDAPVITKPSMAEDVATRLLQLIGRSETGTESASVRS